MSDPDMRDKIIDAVSIPVKAKVRIGHFVEAQVIQTLGVDYIDESELLTPADSGSAHSSAETMWPSSGSACCSAGGSLS
jgi:pyridoxal biosynthesis lyase PdxS